jgi:hypothetical protein
MKFFLLLIGASLLIACSGSKYVTVDASEADAKIIVDGNNLGSGNLKVKVPYNSCVNVKIQKYGFLRYEQEFCNRKETITPHKQFFDMKKDDAIEASLKTDQANVDFEVTVNKNLDLSEAWKLTTRIVTDYFDAIEVSDKETSYLRTAWSVQSYSQNTIRSRFIVKLSNSNPLTFKVKMVSEHSDVAGTGVKDDERFKEWDRVLKKYQNIITDFQTRLANK